MINNSCYHQGRQSEFESVGAKQGRILANKVVQKCHPPWLGCEETFSISNL